MAHSPDSKWLTVADVAEMLRTSTETVRRMIKAGELPASRASNARRAAWLINAVEFERQRESDAERAVIRQRLGGVVVGRGEEFAEKLEQAYPGFTVGSPDGPTLAEHARATIARHELLDQLAVEMAGDEELHERFETLDEDERIEVAAQELARRVREHESIQQRIQRRALEILDEDDEL